MDLAEQNKNLLKEIQRLKEQIKEKDSMNDFSKPFSDMMSPMKDMLPQFNSLKKMLEDKMKQAEQRIDKKPDIKKKNEVLINKKDCSITLLSDGQIIINFSDKKYSEIYFEKLQEK
ncbi:MAG: hypothetical protein A2W11_03125 [Ignavibacteria bacterium RBG_16_35_7]|nr:MAG: hypothetical protein A2W11_03125 [Ignavibacteria bacterium RBG_16_35_7]